MNGKSKCRILKDIRKQIARNNDIEFVTSECKFQGDCSGTCPKCEGELRYLEAELKKRQRAGKAVAVAGIGLALVVGSAGCAWDNPFGPKSTDGAVEQSEEFLMGDVAVVPNDEPETVKGEPVVPEKTGEVDLAGDVEADPTEEATFGDVAYEE